MARILMAHLPGMARTIIMVPECLEQPLARTNVHGPKPVQPIEVLPYSFEPINDYILPNRSIWQIDHLAEEETSGCFSLVAFLLSGGCLCSVSPGFACDLRL